MEYESILLYFLIWINRGTFSTIHSSRLNVADCLLANSEICSVAECRLQRVTVYYYDSFLYFPFVLCCAFFLLLHHLFLLFLSVFSLLSIFCKGISIDRMWLKSRRIRFMYTFVCWWSLVYAELSKRSKRNVRCTTRIIITFFFSSYFYCIILHWTITINTRVYVDAAAAVGVSNSISRTSSLFSCTSQWR